MGQLNFPMKSEKLQGKQTKSLLVLYKDFLKQSSCLVKSCVQLSI